MKITPYISWPKLNKLKVGDRIRIRKDAFNSTFIDYNHKWVIIENITLTPKGTVISCKIEGLLCEHIYSIKAFEVEV